MQDICDENYIRYIGWQENPGLRSYFSSGTVDFIYNKVSQLLEGVHPEGKTIVVTKKSICHVMSNVYQNAVPMTEDIYSRYTIPQSGAPINLTSDMIDRTIQIITSTVRNEMGMIENNNKLTVWTTVLGDFNTHGLRSHSIIKVRNRRPNPLEFNMNY